MRLFFVFLFSILPITNIFSTTWQRNIENYDKLIYQAGHQNWQIRQADNKWMYFANSSGLLEFDGITWNLYPIKNKQLRSILISGKRIYAGGTSEFGYYQANNIGLLTYHSFNTSGWGGEVWNIYKNKEIVYFISDGNIHMYNENTGKIKSIETYLYFQKIDCSVFFNNTLYIGTVKGVYKLQQNDSLEFLPYTKDLANKKIVSLLVYDKTKLIAITSHAGLYFLEENNCRPYSLNPEADLFIQQNQLFCGAISKNRIVLGTVQNGAIITEINNPDGEIEKFNLSTGLNNNTILSTYFDNADNLWLGADRGINFIDMQSHIRPLFAKISTIGTGYCSITHNGKLYLGTNQGLYQAERDNIELVPNANGQIWSLREYDNSLFACGDNGITIISPSETYYLNVKGCWDIKKTKDPDKLMLALYSGFGVLEKVGNKWTFSHLVPQFFLSTRGFFVDPKEENTFWTVDLIRHKINKISLDKYFSKIVRAKEYSLKNTVFEENPYIREIENSIVVCTKNGVYRYSFINDSFVQFTELNQMLEGNRYYDYLDVDGNNNLWYISDGIMRLIEFKNGAYSKRKRSWTLNTEITKGFDNIFNVDPRYAIVTIDNGFLQIDRSKEKVRGEELNLSIRKFYSIMNDSIISYNNVLPETILPYSQNSIRFLYTATGYGDNKNILYSYKLEGFDETWSTPSSSITKDYTNLSEGRYTFLVKAYKKDTPQKVTQTELKFKITPPWYRSAWIYILYCFISIFSSYIIIKKLIKHKQKKIIQERNEILAKKIYFEAENKQKDKEILKLQNETLQKDIAYKTQELTGYILNLTQKNEMLQVVKKNAVSISKALDEKQTYSMIKQKIVKMIGLISSNIEHDNDFKIFESSFDFVHQGFLKKLDEKHPDLTRNEKILFAYLKMNLTSKEIASLMNISVRGVEVSRYRLRKKLGLDREVNLSEYANKIN